MAIVRALVVVFIQLVNMQSLCEESSSPCTLSEWTMSYEENTEARFLSTTSVSQLHPNTQMSISFLFHVYKCICSMLLWMWGKGGTYILLVVM